MFDIIVNPNCSNECIIPTEQLIELLQYKVDALIIAKNEDSSWNYPIDELKEQISNLKATL